MIPPGATPIRPVLVTVRCGERLVFSDYHTDPISAVIDAYDAGATHITVHNEDDR